MGYFFFFLYSLFTLFVPFLFHFAAIFYPRVRKFLLIRRDYYQDLRRKFKDPVFCSLLQSSDVSWFHAASVGELDQAKAMGRELKKRKPDCFLAISWISDSVTEKNFQDSPADVHIPLSPDSPFSYSWLFRALKPRKVLVFSWDSWPWFVRSAKNSGALVYLVCATLNARSGRIGFFAKHLTRLQYRWMDGIFPAHEIHRKRFGELLGYPSLAKDSLKESSGKFPYSHLRLEVLGDTRFDAVVEKIQTQSPPSSFVLFSGWISKFPQEKPIIYASSYPVCEEVLIEFLESVRTYPRQNPKAELPCLWIFPHKIERRRMDELKKKLEKIYLASRYSSPNNKITDSSWNMKESPWSFAVCYYSELFSDHRPEDKAKDSVGFSDPDPDRGFPRVILFDEMGILAFAYRFGRFAYVGGALHNRIHNVIEPAYFGLPLASGERIENSSEAMVLREQGGLRCATRKGLPEILKEMYMSEDGRMQKIGEANRNFVLGNLGASSRIYQRLYT